MTTISWADTTWNPWWGCAQKSAGCRFCYAELTAATKETNPLIAHHAGVATMVTLRDGSRIPQWSGNLTRSPAGKFEEPLRWRTPRLVFVNSMSDFFFEGKKNVAPAKLIIKWDGWRVEALDVMGRAPQHRYQVLTKRPELIRGFMERAKITSFGDYVWIGATVEDRDGRDPVTGGRVLDRIDMIRDVPAGVRFLSVEPMIGDLGKVDLSGIDWVICGGEATPKHSDARLIRLEWVRRLRDQCIEQGTRFFFKQWGMARFNPLAPLCPPGANLGRFIDAVDPGHPLDGAAGGALVDGRLWSQFPDNWESSRLKANRIARSRPPAPSIPAVGEVA